MTKQSIAMILVSALLTFFCAACCCPTGPDCCGIVPPDTTGGRKGDSGIVCIWVSADKDTYASKGRVTEEGDRNFGGYGSLVVANGPLGIKQSYVHFTPPKLPAGTEIIESKLELYHGGRNEDGSSDDVLLSVAPIRNEPWSPMTLTWNNRPDRDGLPSVESEIRLRSQNWSGTPDITGLVSQMIASPNAYHGFMIWYRDPSGRQLEKGFYSNNDVRRTQTDLGLAPRLLMRVQLPPGATTADFRLGYLPSDTDLTVPREVTMVRTRPAANDRWPADWNVSP